MTAHAQVLALARAADQLARGARRRSGLPSLFLFTDPERTPDPVDIVGRLPPRVGVVFRAFGRHDAVPLGRALRRACAQDGRVLLAGADATLAARIDADGVHLPQRLAATLPRLRARRPRWIISVAAHDASAARSAALAGADAVFVSPVFASRSASAGRPLGPLRLSAIVRLTPAPVYALGGVSSRTVRRLLITGAAGVAAVEALA